MDAAKGKSQHRKKRNKTIAFTRIIFILVFVWFLGNSLFNFFLGFFIDTQVVEVQMIEDKYATKGYVLREEVIINAPVTGSVIKQIADGERVAIGKVVFEVLNSQGTALEAGEPVKVTAPMSGVVSYITDGLESYFQPNQLQVLNMQKIEKLEENLVDNTKKNMVEKGKRYCKIVNNLSSMQIYLEFPVDIFGEPLTKGTKVDIIFPTIAKEVAAPIIDLKGIGKTAQVLLEVPETWYELINTRSVPVEIIVDTKEGMIIPKKALVNKNNETGLYWLRKGFVFWQSVKIIAEENENVIINGLEPLTEVILTPNLVKEGQHLY